MMLKYNILISFSCLGDYLQFYDGGTFNSPKLGKPLCGTHLPSSVTSSGNVMLARFVTDKDTSHEGFKASYSIGRVLLFLPKLLFKRFPLTIYCIMRTKLKILVLVYDVQTNKVM